MASIGKDQEADSDSDAADYIWRPFVEVIGVREEAGTPCSAGEEYAAALVFADEVADEPDEVFHAKQNRSSFFEIR